ncbi:MAG: rod shape-determining protein MreD [Deltaproteobacteria bacterium]|nr:rod shape-determining protein MreD [Deltaproteobacteria bacterium]MBN2687836.1 rod shape-determining protein MreD [Deltaproteobacteria bacterium]
MIYYGAVFVLSIFLVVFQSTALDLLFLGKIRLELSLIVVIYGGLYMDAVKGGVLSLLLGFLLDSMTGVMPGLYTFIYVAVFALTKRLSYRVYPEGITTVILLTFFCSLAEGMIIVLIYKTGFGIDAFHEIFNTYLLQSLVVAVIAPACFSMLHKIQEITGERAET